VLTFSRRVAAVAFASFLLAVPCVLAAPRIAHARTLDKIITDKTLVVGVNPTLPPLGEYDSQNKVVGFDVDVAKRIAKMLGVKLKLVNVTSSDRIPFVVSGKVDIVMGAITRTPARAKVIDFTVPIMTESLSVLTFADKSFKSWRDLNTSKVTLVEVRGTTPVTFIKDHLPKAKVLLLDNYPDAIRALAQGRGDAMIDVVEYLTTYMKNYHVKWKVLPQPLGGVDYDAIGLAQGNDTLRRWLNVALFALQSEGTIDRIYKHWFGIGMVPPIVPQPYF